MEWTEVGSGRIVSTEGGRGSLGSIVGKQENWVWWWRRWSKEADHVSVDIVIPGDRVKQVWYIMKGEGNLSAFIIHRESIKASVLKSILLKINKLC